jgi:hypothetical protein
VSLTDWRFFKGTLLRLENRLSGGRGDISHIAKRTKPNDLDSYLLHEIERRLGRGIVIVAALPQEPAQAESAAHCTLVQ